MLRLSYIGNKLFLPINSIQTRIINVSFDASIYILPTDLSWLLARKVNANSWLKNHGTGKSSVKKQKTFRLGTWHKIFVSVKSWSLATNRVFLLNSCPLVSRQIFFGSHFKFRSQNQAALLWTYTQQEYNLTKTEDSHADILAIGKLLQLPLLIKLTRSHREAQNPAPFPTLSVPSHRKWLL